MINGVRAALEQMAEANKEEVTYPHKMYHPETGEEVTAKTPEEHDEYAKKGYTHEKPEVDKPKEDASNDKSDDGEGLDKVDPKAAAKKFKDRKDKDIDNDGDVDSSDEYLHKRRKAIGKAMKKESTIRERLTAIWEDAAKHTMGATDPEPMTKDDERSAKKMKDGHGAVKVMQNADDSTEAEKVTKPAAMRGNDNKQGDKNAIPSATKDHPANKTTKEQFDAIAKAYSEVLEPLEETVLHDIDHTDTDFQGLLKKHNVKHTVVKKGPNKGYNSIKLTGKSSNVKRVLDTMGR